MTHQPSQDQDLRTALELARDTLEGLAHDVSACEWLKDSDDSPLAQINAALTPAQAPDKAGDREGLDAGPWQKLMGAKIARINHPTNIPSERVIGWRVPDEFAGLSDGLFLLEGIEKQVAAALAPQPNGTEASRGVIPAGWKLVPEKLTDAMIQAARAAKINGTNLTADDWIGGASQKDLEDIGGVWPTSPWDRGHEVAEQVHEILFATWWAAMFAATPTPPLSPDSTGPAGDEDGVAHMIWNAVFWSSGRSWDKAPERDMGKQKARALARDICAALTPSAPIAAPVRDDGPRRELAELIRSGLLGVSPDSQELELEDKDWRLILDALGYPAPAGDVPGEAQTQEGGR